MNLPLGMEKPVQNTHLPCLTPPKPTTRDHASTHNVIPDDFVAFLEKDRLLSYEDLCFGLVMGEKVDISVRVTSYCIE